MVPRSPTTDDDSRYKAYHLVPAVAFDAIPPQMSPGTSPIDITRHARGNQQHSQALHLETPGYFDYNQQIRQSFSEFDQSFGNRFRTFDLPRGAQPWLESDSVKVFEDQEEHLVKPLLSPFEVSVGEQGVQAYVAKLVGTDNRQRPRKRGSCEQGLAVDHFIKNDRSSNVDLEPKLERDRSVQHRTV